MRATGTGAVAPGGERVAARGKYLWWRGAPLRVCGVTYGTFARREDGAAFPRPDVIEHDLVAMAGLGVNCLRTYEVPPPELLDIAGGLGLHVVAGIHYDDWRSEPSAGLRARRRILDAGRRAVDQALDVVAGRPEMLALAVGNEVPVDLVRLHGRRSVEATLAAVVDHAQAGDDDLLVTYVNFPSTEFLEVPNADLAAFNVFLESPAALRRYLEHLQLLSGDKPVLVGELGLAAAVHGRSRQAESLAEQLRQVDEAGVAGAFVFSWTDDWVVAGEAVEGWGFGVTEADRTLKPAAQAVSEWSGRSWPKGLRDGWPRVTAVVRAYNEEPTIAACVDSLLASSYPDLEVIVCDDGSTDATPRIVAERPVRLLRLGHGGLSRARNAGIDAATGEVVAFLDADAACHPDWPYHLVLSLEEDGVVATGGPNLPVAGVGLVERAIAHCPGQATEVMLGPRRAEHVPGCNMAFRRAALVELAGFDPRYVTAGDDVDLCWRILDGGHEIGFSPAAQVDHHRRGTIRGYLRQQRGYGRAERLLAGAHKHRLNGLGQARWRGFVYGPTPLLPRLLRPTVYTGWFGTAPFQPAISNRARASGDLVVVTLPLVVAAGLAAAPFALLAPAAGLVTLCTALWFAGVGVATAASVRPARDEPHPGRLRALAGLLTVLQPVVRTWGRLTGPPSGLAPAPRPAWSGDRAQWLHELQVDLRRQGRRVAPAADGQFWDLEVTDRGPVSARLTTAVAWSWEPRAKVRYRLRPAWAAGLAATVVAVAASAAVAPLLAAAGAGAAAIAVLASGVRTHVAVREALRRTTAGAVVTASRVVVTASRVVVTADGAVVTAAGDREPAPGPASVSAPPATPGPGSVQAAGADVAG